MKVPITSKSLIDMELPVNISVSLSMACPTVADLAKGLFRSFRSTFKQSEVSNIIIIIIIIMH